MHSLTLLDILGSSQCGIELSRIRLLMDEAN